MTSKIAVVAFVAALLAATANAFLGCEKPAPWPSQMQEDALQKFYKNTGGKDKKWPEAYRSGWENPNGICAFDGNPKLHSPNPYGTRCLYGGFHPEPPKGDGGVMYLNHISGMAEGTLPEEFKAFWMITIISLHGNKLSGSIWDTSQHCFLFWLDLSSNQFSGSLPDNFMAGGGLHFATLNLGKNKFSGSLPASLNKLEGLIALQLNDNEFSGSIPDLSHMKTTRHLRLSNNKLSGTLGGWFKELQNLAWVEIENNQLEGPLPPLPSTVSRFTASGNKFSGKIPESYATGVLRHFECTGCNLECPSEDFLAHLPYSTHCHKNARKWATAS